MGELFFLVANLNLYLFLTIISVIVLIQVAHSILRYVNDTEEGYGIFFLKYKFVRRCVGTRSDDLFKFIAIIGASVIAAFILAIVWPLVYTILIGYGIIFGVRTFIRLKKKITSALGLKADKEHTH
jgi:hypothetical protein